MPYYCEIRRESARTLWGYNKKNNPEDGLSGRVKELGEKKEKKKKHLLELYGHDRSKSRK